MLFKALIERLLGSDEAQDWKEQDRAKTSRFSYNNYPNLIHILSSLLESAGIKITSGARVTENPGSTEADNTEGVFPALQILRQALPPETRRLRFREQVRCLLYSPHWHLRDMAARTFISLTRGDEYLDTSMLLLENFHGPSNYQHGTFLCLKYMVMKMWQSRGISASKSTSTHVNCGIVVNPCCRRLI